MKTQVLYHHGLHDLYQNYFVKIEIRPTPLEILWQEVEEIIVLLLCAGTSPRLLVAALSFPHKKVGK